MSQQPSSSQTAIASFVTSQAVHLLTQCVQPDQIGLCVPVTQVVQLPSVVLGRIYSKCDSAENAYWLLVEYLLKHQVLRANTKHVCFVQCASVQTLSCGCGDMALIDCTQVSVPDEVALCDVYNEYSKQWKVGAETEDVLRLLAAVLHEMGHCFGLPHTNTGIMSASYVHAMRTHALGTQAHTTTKSSYTASCTTDTALFDPNSVQWLKVKLRHSTVQQPCRLRVSGCSGHDSWTRSVTCEHGIEIIELRVEGKRVASWDLIGEGVYTWSVFPWIMDQYGLGCLVTICVHAHQHSMLVG